MPRCSSRTGIRCATDRRVRRELGETALRAAARRDAALRAGNVILLDLWAGRSHTTVFADQTWIGFAGSRPPEPVERVWCIVRQARDAAIETVRRAAAERRPIAGFEADRAARAVVEAADSVMPSCTAPDTRSIEIYTVRASSRRL